MDTKLTCWQIKAADKVATVVTADLSIIMSNTHTPKTSKRRLFMSTINTPVVLYSCTEWKSGLMP